MPSKKTRDNAVTAKAVPLTNQSAHETQPYGQIISAPIALAEAVRRASIDNLTQLQADTMALRDLYKKHHWQVTGPTFYQLHLLFDKHAGEQSEWVDLLAERIQSLGGIALAVAHDVAEHTIIPRPPKGREEVPVQISRLLHAHEVVLKESRTMAKQAAAAGDDGTNDVLVSTIIRGNELQVWFVSQHVVDTPLARAN